MLAITVLLCILTTAYLILNEDTSPEEIKKMLDSEEWY